MSNDKNAPATPITVHTVPEETAPAEKKPNFIQRSVSYVKSHPKTALAVVGLAALTVGAAVAGPKKSNDSTPAGSFEPNVYELELAEVDESTDSTVA